MSLGCGKREVVACGDLDGSRSVILVRHAQTTWSREGRYQGRSDPPLSPQGIDEAIGVVARLRNVGIASVVSSPLSRAFLTAQIIADGLHLPPPTIEPRLIEVAYGDWEGLTQQEIKARWPSQLKKWKSTPATFQFPGGESLTAANARLDGFLSEQSARFNADPRPMVAVTHCGLIRLAVLNACAAPIEGFRSVRAEHGSAHRFLLNPSHANGMPDLRLLGEL